MRSVSSNLRQFTGLFQARLSRRIVFWTFLSLVVIEAILLVPSAARRRQEILQQIEEVSSGKVQWILVTYPDATGEELLGHVQQLRTDPMLALILGGAVYEPDGDLVGTFGEVPALSFAEAQAGEELYLQPQNRYESAWIAPMPSGEHTIVIRHDATGTQAELFAYILRIVGLVLIIAAFVTLVMMIYLGPELIYPVLTLREDLSKVGNAVCEDQPNHASDQFQSVKLKRQDELGEVISTFQQMFQRICQAIAERKQAEAELRQHNEQMRQYLEQVDRVTLAAVALETGEFQPETLDSVSQRPDELGQLARVFQQMAREVQQREADLKRQLAELKIEIDQQRVQQEVAQITESQYFQELQAEISQMKVDEFWS
jgi:phage shock protein A